MIDERFFLSGDGAYDLYTAFVRDLPIVDYHDHLSWSDLKTDRRFTDLVDLWLLPDPYKHRAMRMAGLPERLITGSADKEEKFAAWCGVFPDLVGNPLYQWSLSELALLGIEERPRRENASRILAQGNDFLAKNVVTPSWFMDRFRVEKVCPCLGLSEELPESTAADRVVPSLRADDALLPAPAFIRSLNAASAADFLAAVEERMRAFYAAGCRFADHSLDDGFTFLPDDGRNETRFRALRNEEPLSAEDRVRLTSFLLTEYLALYGKIGMTVQLHLGAHRSTSARLRALAGPAGGYAAAGNEIDLGSVVSLFDAAEQKAPLPKMVLFPLNPVDSAKIAILSGSFARDGVKGLVTLGPAWWWNDHRRGMRRALEEMAAGGLLSVFVGMTTDSRSFLSLVRHDAFRRVLCDAFARADGERALLCDREDAGRILRKMAYENAAELFREVER